MLEQRTANKVVNKAFCYPTLYHKFRISYVILAGSFLFPNWRKEAGEVDDFLTSMFFHYANTSRNNGEMPQSNIRNVSYTFESKESN